MTDKTVNVIGIAPAGSLETLRGILSGKSVFCRSMLSAGAEFSPSSLPGGLQCAVMYTDELLGEDFSFLEKLHGWRPEIPIVVLSDSTSLDVYERAMRCGATRLLSADTDPDSIVSAVCEEGERAAAAGAGRAGETKGKLISFYSPKGGSGKTFCAVNAASVFSAAGKKTLLIDGVHPFGDVLYLLGADGRPFTKMPELYSEFELCPGAIQSPSGIYILNPYEVYEERDCADPEFVKDVLFGYCHGFDYVIADLPSDYSAVTNAVLSASDRIEYVLTSDLTAVRTAWDFFHEYDYGYYNDKSSIILNRGTANGYSVKSIEHTLERPVDAVLPLSSGDNAALPSSGESLVFSKPMSRFSKAFRQYFCREYSLDDPAPSPFRAA